MPLSRSVFRFFSLFCFSFSTWLKFSSSFCRLFLCVLSPSAFVLLAFASKFSFSFGQFFHSRRRCRRCRFFSVVAVVVIWVSLADAVAVAIVAIVVVVFRVVVLNQISIILFVAIFITFRFHSRLSACNKAQSESLARRKNERKRENRRKSEKKSGKWKIAYNTHTHKHSNTQNRNRERDQHTVPQCGAAIVRTLNYGAGNPCGSLPPPHPTHSATATVVAVHILWLCFATL